MMIMPGRMGGRVAFVLIISPLYDSPLHMAFQNNANQKFMSVPSSPILCGTDALIGR
jgi:hypothetical protein